MLNTAPAACNAGSYSSAVGSSTCAACPAGTYTQDTGMLRVRSGVVLPLW